MTKNYTSLTRFNYYILFALMANELTSEFSFIYE